MAELLLELFSEEIPAKMQQPMAERFKHVIDEKLSKENLFHSNVKTFITPRRLVLTIDGLSLTQEDAVVEKKGPRVDAPKAAIEGFLRSANLTLEQLTKRTTDKGEFYFAIYEQKGKATKDILKSVLEETIPSLIWPKSMRWGSHSVKWIRPIKNICCIFGGEVLPITFGHLKANNISFGHRFLSGGEFKVNNFKDFKDDLKKNYVVLETADRQQIIQEQASKVANDRGFKVLEDEKLLEEVSGLVEWPEVLLGAIDESYMHLPEEILISSIRIHQKYFCLRDDHGSLVPHFFVVSNMKSDDEGVGIVAGNERVLRARLADARFFWDQDRQRALDTRVEDLERVVFHAKLGTMSDKTKRIQAGAKFLAVWVPHANLDLVERAGLLCKADLVTEMVGEFPDLQGIMGYYYAKEAGENDEVSLAIKEHYSPLGPNDDCPSASVSVAVSIADKVDTLAGLFAIGEKPTGSKDPFALRRAALGVIRMILENNLSVPLKILFEHALKQYPKSLFVVHDDENGEEEKKGLLDKIKHTKKIKPSSVVDELLEFFGERLKALLKGDKVRHDLITAVFDGGSEDDLNRVVKRVAALDHFLKTEDGENLLAAYRRATNIVSIEEKNDNTTYKASPSKSLLDQVQERDLYNMIQKIKPEIKKALKENKFEEAMELLSHLRNPIDAFFESVTVNCDSSDLRKNRLKLLAGMRELLDEIANFALIEG